jgi:hypothetical protein
MVTELHLMKIHNKLISMKRFLLFFFTDFFAEGVVVLIVWKFQQKFLLNSKLAYSSRIKLSKIIPF